jgi:hypothetical protein
MRQFCALFARFLSVFARIAPRTGGGERRARPAEGERDAERRRVA